MSAERRFRTPRPVRLEVKVQVAHIEVVTVDGDESIVSLTGAPTLLEATSVELVGERIVIEQRRKSLGGFLGLRDGSLRIQARVPHHSRVEVATATGGVELDGSFAGLETKSVSGDVRLTGELDGDATVKTVSGDVRLERVTGDLTAQTVSGQVTAASVGGSVAVKSVSGDVRIGSLSRGTATVRSVSGNVELGIAPGTCLDLDAGSASGELSSEVVLTGAPNGEPGPAVIVRSQTVSGDFRVFRAA